MNFHEILAWVLIVVGVILITPLLFLAVAILAVEILFVLLFSICVGVCTFPVRYVWKKGAR